MNFIFDTAMSFIKDLVNDYAPHIANKIGGMFHDQAAEAVKKATGIDINIPGADKALQNMTEEQKLSLGQQEIEILKIESSDRENARKREVDLSNTKWGWISLIVQNLGAIVIMSIFICLNVYALFTHGVDPQDRSQIITSDIAIIMLLVGYWWGKSKVDKD